MSETDGFFARWVRRKRAAGATTRPDEPARDSAVPAGDTEDESPARVAPPGGDAPCPPEPPAVDLASLPPLESITASTDIRAFLAPGVPAELSRAALRRAWSADPAIREFVGIAENQWDFTALDGVQGFGPLTNDDDVRKLVAKVLGDGAPDGQGAADAAASGEQEAANPAETAALPNAVAESTPAEVESGSCLHREDDDGASQHATDRNQDPMPPPSRGHGGALPQ